MGRGRGGGGRGGGGGSGSGGSGGGGGGFFRFRFLRRLGIGGPGSETKRVLRRLAIAKGLRDVDDLLVKLGKQDDDINLIQALHMLREEIGSDAYKDTLASLHYGPGKGYANCNRTLRLYLKCVKNPEGNCKFGLRELKKYCGYTEDELELLKQSQ